MYRIVILVLLMGCSAFVAADKQQGSAQTYDVFQSEGTSAGLSSLQDTNIEASTEECNNTQVAMGCCKICRKGKACGDSCISRSKTCHKGPGCACDG